MTRRRSLRFVCRVAAGLLVLFAAGVFSSMTLARSKGAAASAAYYDYCPGGSSAGTYGYCPPTTTTTTPVPPRLVVIKHVVNDSGRSAVAAQFTMTVSGSGATPSTFPGSETGTTVTLNPGSYGVSETGPAGYAASFSADCGGTISAGQTKTCTVTNDDWRAVVTSINTECATFKAGNASELPQVDYRVRTDGTIGELIPWNIRYWTQVRAPAASFTIEVAQTVTHPSFGTLFDLADTGQVRLHDATCHHVIPSAVSIAGEQARVTVTGATPGNVYLLSVWYKGVALQNKPAPTPSTIHYDFQTKLNGVVVDGDLNGLDVKKR